MSYVARITILKELARVFLKIGLIAFGGLRDLFMRNDCLGSQGGR